MIGVVNDEATLFTLSLGGIRCVARWGSVVWAFNWRFRTESELRRYLQHFHLPDATEEEVDKLLELYPDGTFRRARTARPSQCRFVDPAQGSPYGTGGANQVTPQWKRLSSIQGDLVFQAPRRMFLKSLSPGQNTWSYCKPCIAFIQDRIVDHNLVSKLLDGFPDLGTVRRAFDPQFSKFLLTDFPGAQ